MIGIAGPDPVGALGGRRKARVGQGDRAPTGQQAGALPATVLGEALQNQLVERGGVLGCGEDGLSL
ncbi:hypothetical protein ACFWPH_30145 [Nocardia sp. NPDC058499]|uniref:hypothetical protein n=1 Tax=Nocardia sp. NPDC058499 TaxID=3346530 RepID=UPI0036495C96